MRALLLLLPLVWADLWAVIVNSSKFWFNYRHTANLLMTYQTFKRLGLDDEHIIVMQPDTTPCNARNPFPSQIFDGHHPENLNQGYIEIDYRGKEVTPDNIVRVLTDRLPPNTPAGKRLRSGPDSHVIVILNGHGGDGYFKIQDTMVLRTKELTDAVSEMREKRRFKQLMVIVDSCQAFSLFSQLDLPGVHLISSSLVGEMAKSIGHHSEVGLSTADRFTFYTYKYLRDKSAAAVSRISVATWLDGMTFDMLRSNIGLKSHTDPTTVSMKDFFTQTRRPFEARGVHSTFVPVKALTHNTRRFLTQVTEEPSIAASPISWSAYSGALYFLYLLAKWLTTPTLIL